MHGSPYYTPEPSRFRVMANVIGWRRLGVLAIGVAAVGGVFYMQMHKRPSEMAIAAVEPPKNTKAPMLGGYEPAAAPPEVDRWKEFLAAQARLEEARQAELDALRDELAAIARQKQLPPKTEKPAEKEKPKPRHHRNMGYMSFELPPDATQDPPTYVLAPGKTKIGCIEETTANSDVENGATVIVNVNIYDTATGQHLLIPQGSTILQEYKSANLLHGNQRLPMFSTLLTLPNGTVHDLESTPTMDQEGRAGLVTRVNNHIWRAVPLVVLQGVMRGSQQVVTTTNPIAGGVAGSVSQYGQKITRPYVDMRPTIEVDGGEGCLVILRRTLELPEYHAKR